MEIETLDVEKSILSKFFSTYDTDLQVIDEILSSNSLRRFNLAVAKHGLAKITTVCILPTAPHTNTKQLYKNLNSTFGGDFI